MNKREGEKGTFALALEGGVTKAKRSVKMNGTKSEKNDVEKSKRMNIQSDLESPISVTSLLPGVQSPDPRPLTKAYYEPDLLLLEDSSDPSSSGRSHRRSQSADGLRDPRRIRENHAKKSETVRTTSFRKKPPQRRNIFGSYWNQCQQQSADENESNATDDSMFRIAHAGGVDVRHFSPPPEVCATSLRKHHALIEDFDGGIVPSTRSLPSLPHPLRRFLGEHQGFGCYPVLSPKSILKTPKFSRNLELDSGEDHCDQLPASALDANTAELATIPSRPGPSFLKEHGRLVSRGTANKIFRTSLQKASSKKGVHFDPRIVISEYDDHMERIWYSEQELSIFKSETIVLAQHYIMINPAVADSLNKERTHPITGKPIKKALFSLPILNALPEDFDPVSYAEKLQHLLKEGIKRILIVDPNSKILELFAKSVQYMFPHAKITTVQSGEEALWLYTTELSRKGHSEDNHRAFDIIIAEERLYRPNAPVRDKVTGNKSMRNMKGQSFSHFHNGAGSRTTKIKKAEKETSLSHLNVLSKFNRQDSTGMTGSDLIERIRELEDQAYGSAYSGLYAPAETLGTIASSVKNSTSRNWRALLIGVSANISVHKDKFQKAGADELWGKPPPQMGIKLRNQILSSLLAKRQEASLSLRIHKNSGGGGT